MSKLSNYRTGQYDTPVTFAVKHKAYDVRMASRSGGIFTALSDRTLENDGVVYGCVLNEDFTAVHIRAENNQIRDLMRGSKYIQSDLRDTFSSVKADLENGRRVLFSGTSCQVAGLRAYLQNNYPRLLCVDIVCHGVPSPLVWKEYLKWHEKKNGSKVTSVNFRNKQDFGWKVHIETIGFENGKYVNSEVFKNLFYSHVVLRPSCFKCPYKDVVHPGDITIADYWGIDNAAPGFNDNKGVSLVLINNDKGKSIFDSVKNELDVVETRIEDSMQPPLKAPFPEPQNRVSFWNDLNCQSFDYIAKKYGTIPFSEKVRKKIRRIIRKLKNNYSH